MSEKTEEIKVTESVFIDGKLATKGSTHNIPVSEARLLIGMGRAVPAKKQTRANKG